MASGGSGVKADALSGYGTASGNANAIYSPLQASYASLATGNDGLTPQQKADALTASGNALGGSTAAIVGEGALREARTGNSGAYSAIADAAMRGADATQSENALGIQLKSDDIARQNQRLGLEGESNLFNNENQDAINYLRVANETQPSFLQQLGQGIISTGLGVAGKKLGG